MVSITRSYPCKGCGKTMYTTAFPELGLEILCEECNGKVRRCLHCGNTQTTKGVALTGRFCSPTCLHDHQREWGQHAVTDWRGIEDGD
jgi:DNA-directed RNA polymerase subunit RPC12/RpoP